MCIRDSYEASADNYTLVNGLPNLVMEETNDNISYYVADLTRRFVNNATQYCPLTHYRISKVMAESSREYVRGSAWA